jgi:hypothetical protein
MQHYCTCLNVRQPVSELLLAEECLSKMFNLMCCYKKARPLLCFSDDELVKHSYPILG